MCGNCPIPWQSSVLTPALHRAYRAAGMAVLDPKPMNRIHPVPIAADGALPGASARFLAPLRPGPVEDGLEISVDVSLREGVYHVRADLPGVERMQVVICIDQDTVTIDAVLLPAPESTDVRAPLVAQVDGRAGALSRFLKLPAAVDEQGARAAVGRGLLIIELPLREPLPRPIRCPTTDPWSAAGERTLRWRLGWRLGWPGR